MNDLALNGKVEQLMAQMAAMQTELAGLRAQVLQTALDVTGA